MVNRGVYEAINGDGLARASFNNQTIRLKPDRYRPYIAEQFQEADSTDPKSIAELSKLAIINTVVIADPNDPDTIWGFYTLDSPKFKSRDLDTDDIE